jgi:hypothetical protein
MGYSAVAALLVLWFSQVQGATTDQEYPLASSWVVVACLMISEAKVATVRYSSVRMRVADCPYEKYNPPFVFPKNPGSIPAYGTANAVAPLRAS